MRRCVSRACSLRSRAARATASLSTSSCDQRFAAYQLALLLLMAQLRQCLHTSGRLVTRQHQANLPRPQPRRHRTGNDSHDARSLHSGTVSATERPTDARLHRGRGHQFPSRRPCLRKRKPSARPPELAPTIRGGAASVLAAQILSVCRGQDSVGLGAVAASMHEPQVPRLVWAAEAARIPVVDLETLP